MTGKPALRSLTLIRLGLFLTSLASLFVDLSQRKFAQQSTIKELAQIWKKNYKK